MRATDLSRWAWPHVAGATFARDMWIATSYRIGFLVSLAGAVLNILNIFFLSSAVGLGMSADVARYGGDYFGFALVGVALSSFMAVGVTGISARIREGQMMGTLELMLLSPNRLGVVLASSSLWGHVQSFVTLLVYLAVGSLLGMDVHRANVPMTILSLALAVVAFNALGMLAASFVIIIKQGNPIALLLGFASVLLSGVLYPTSVLPEWLRVVGQALPLTHALELIRRSMLEGAGVTELWPSLLAMVILTVVLLPLGLWACHLAVRVAQTDGSLSHY